MKRSLLVVLHGKQAGNLDVRRAVSAARYRGHRVEVRVTWEAGDAARIVREAIAMSIDTVIAGGGDGTINEVTQLVAADAAAKVSLGFLPLGTANDFAIRRASRLSPKPLCS